MPNNENNRTDSNDTTGYDSVRNEKYEMHNEEAVVVVNEADIDGDEELLMEDDVYDADTIKSPSNFGASRWTLYKGLEALANRYIEMFIFLSNGNTFLVIFIIFLLDVDWMDGLVY